MNDEYENHINKIIKEARESGAFENLPGKGKPIQWEDDSNVPEHMRMANRILHNQGVTLDWIEIGRELDAEYEKLRQKLEMVRKAKAEGRISAEGWFAAVDDYQEKVRALNRRVLGYNLRVPHERFQKQAYSVDVGES